jgi:hypothetical protein
MELSEGPPRVAVEGVAVDVVGLVRARVLGLATELGPSGSDRLPWPDQVAAVARRGRSQRHGGGGAGPGAAIGQRR